MGSEWPPSERALTLYCIILRFIPNMNGEGGCRPIFRIYGQDPFMAIDRTPKVMFYTPKKSKHVQYYKQVACELVKIDIHCHVLGDVVLEYISLDNDHEQESMMFRAMFNTAFIKSNILVLNCEEIDILWNAKDQFSKDFKAEVIFSEINVATSVISTDLPDIEEKHGLPMQAFAKVQDSFINVDCLSPKTDVANGLQENLETGSLKGVEGASVLHNDKVKEKPKLQASEHIITSPESAALEEQSTFSFKPALDANSTRQKFEPQEVQVAPQKPTLNTSSFRSSSDSSPIEGKSELQELQVTPQEPDHSKTSIQPFVEANSMRRKLEIQELHVALQQPAQSTSSGKQYCNSLQGSPVPISRYRCASSALGITALLHDHAISQSEERIHPVKLPLSSSSISSPLSNTPKSLQLSLAIASPTSPSPGPEFTVEAPLTTKASPVLSPEVILKTTHTQHPGTTSPDRGHSSFIPPPPPLPSLSAKSSAIDNSNSTLSISSLLENSFSAPPSPSVASSPTCSISSLPQLQTPGPPTPPPPSVRSGSVSDPTGKSLVPHASPPPVLAPKDPSNNSAHVPPVPPPPAPCAKGLCKACGTGPQSDSVSNGSIPSIPGPPSGAPLNLKGWGISRAGPKNQAQSRKSNLKPYHWLKLTRAMQGSLGLRHKDLRKLPTAPNLDDSIRDGKSNRRASHCKSEKVQLIELRRAYNCEIMLTKVKIPLPDLMSSVLALDDTTLDADKVENLIKFCPTKEEMELLKGYNGDKENLGKCEQFFLELMKVPWVESLRVFSFKIQFCSHVSDLRNSLNIVNSAAEEASLLSFSHTIAFSIEDVIFLKNLVICTIHRCNDQVLAQKLPELLDFPKDLETLEASTKIQLKYLAEEMQAINRGLEKVVQELTASENDGPVSETFCRTLKQFPRFAEGEVRSLASLYSSVVYALALYFGEDPARCPFEQVVSTLLNFVRMFVQAHKENCKQLELQKKKAQKEAEN
ncbi:hypothetical protein PTKIN_Ptkin03bG0177700 [Pterospermum kingtungense]